MLAFGALRLKNGPGRWAALGPRRRAVLERGTLRDREQAPSSSRPRRTSPTESRDKGKRRPLATLLEIQGSPAGIAVTVGCQREVGGASCRGRRLASSPVVPVTGERPRPVESFPSRPRACFWDYCLGQQPASRCQRRMHKEDLRLPGRSRAFSRAAAGCIGNRERSWARISPTSPRTLSVRSSWRSSISAPRQGRRRRPTIRRRASAKPDGGVPAGQWMAFEAREPAGRAPSVLGGINSTVWG